MFTAWLNYTVGPTPDPCLVTGNHLYTSVCFV